MCPPLGSSRLGSLGLVLGLAWLLAFGPTGWLGRGSSGCTCGPGSSCAKPHAVAAPERCLKPSGQAAGTSHCCRGKKGGEADSRFAAASCQLLSSCCKKHLETLSSAAPVELQASLALESLATTRERLTLPSLSPPPWANAPPEPPPPRPVVPAG